MAWAELKPEIIQIPSGTKWTLTETSKMEVQSLKMQRQNQALDTSATRNSKLVYGARVLADNSIELKVKEHEILVDEEPQGWTFADEVGYFSWTKDGYDADEAKLTVDGEIDETWFEWLSFRPVAWSYQDVLDGKVRKLGDEWKVALDGVGFFGFPQGPFTGELNLVYLEDTKFEGREVASLSMKGDLTGKLEGRPGLTKIRFESTFLCDPVSGLTVSSKTAGTFSAEIKEAVDGHGVGEVKQGFDIEETVHFLTEEEVAAEDKEIEAALEGDLDEALESDDDDE